MVIQIIASGTLIGIGAVVFAQGSVVAPTQIRWLLSGAVLCLIGASLLATTVFGR